MKCSICGYEIKPKIVGKDKETGKTITWKDGNNAQPINDGRCCDYCNENAVIPERIIRAQTRGGRE